MNIPVSKLFQRSPEIIASEIDGEMVMMDKDFEFYYGLHAIGTEIWSLLENPNSIQMIAESLTERYDVSMEQCIDDVKPLIADFIENGMVLEV